MPDDFSRLHKRCTWLNGNVFQASPINKEAIQALATIHPMRAMEMLKEVEEKAEKVKNPSGYLKSAAARESPVSSQISIDPAVEKRCKWLNFNLFKDNKIDGEAIALLSSLGWARAMELCKELETKGEQVRSPSKYIKAAAARELPTEYHQGNLVSAEPVQAGNSPNADRLVHRRCTWINGNVLQGKEIAQEAIWEMSMLGVDGAMKLCKELEAKAEQIKNPNNYIHAAVSRALGGSGGEVMLAGASQQSTSGNYERVKKRCTWLSRNIFTNSAINDETVALLANLEFSRAMELCKEIEEKGAEKVANPSGYLGAAARRETQGFQGHPPKRARS